ncbi:MAG: DNA mismatch repair endonuclease MutL [Bacillota bacterium]
MAEIKKLSEQIANQISAGEVVERPASVVKELIENSLDANASNIKIVIKDGGKELIKVNDNGQGIKSDQIELAFSRYATSKIEKVNDLYSLESLGFRGEALASIAAVAKVTAKSCHKEEKEGLKLVLEGGEIVDKEIIGYNKGLEITVKELFFNTPARYKYLKKTSTEAAHISRIITAAALARPDVKFTLEHNGNITITTPGNKNLKDVIYSIYGENIYNKLIPIKFKDNFIEVSGYVVDPDILRSSRQHQYYFVNGRPVYNKFLRLAVEEAYRELFGIKKYPLIFLNLNLNPILVDVNVHPTKREVKFSRGKDIKKTIKSNIKDILIKNQQKSDSTRFNQQNFKNNYNQNKTDYKSKSSKKDKSLKKEVEYLPSRLELTGNIIKEDVNEDNNQFIKSNSSGESISNEKNNIDEFHETDKKNDDLVIRNILGQLHKLFIIVETNQGVLLVDQHNAHERILYDNLKEKINNKENDSRMLLTPIQLNLNAQEKEILAEIKNELNKFGFKIDEFGPSQYAVTSVPDFIKDQNPEDSINDLINHLLETTKIAKNNELIDELLKYNSCRKAVKEGKYLSKSEMVKIINELFNTSNPYYCPHYRPIIINFSIDELKQKVERYD